MSIQTRKIFISNAAQLTESWIKTHARSCENWMRVFFSVWVCVRVHACSSRCRWTCSAALLVPAAQLRQQHGENEEDPGLRVQGASSSTTSSLHSGQWTHTHTHTKPSMFHRLSFHWTCVVLCGQSVTGLFSDCGGDEVEVNCSLEKNQFILHRGDKDGGIPLKVRHTQCTLSSYKLTFSH